MRETRNEQYLHRELACLALLGPRRPVDGRQNGERNVRIATGGAAAAVAVVGGGSIGGAKTKEAKKA